MTGCCGRMEVIMGDDVTLHAINGRALFFMRAIKGHTTTIIAQVFRGGNSGNRTGLVKFLALIPFLIPSKIAANSKQNSGGSELCAF